MEQIALKWTICYLDKLLARFCAAIKADSFKSNLIVSDSSKKQNKKNVNSDRKLWCYKAGFITQLKSTDSLDVFFPITVTSPNGPLHYKHSINKIIKFREYIFTNSN